MKLTTSQLSSICRSVQSCAECSTEVHQACAEWRRYVKTIEPWEMDNLLERSFGVGNEKMEKEPKGD